MKKPRLFLLLPFACLFAGSLILAGCATTRAGRDGARTGTATADSSAADSIAGTVVPRTIPRTVPRSVPLAAQPGLDTVRAGRFDFGKMWTFEDPPVEYLRETYNFTPDASWFERARLGALRLPNCSASFVSPNGLVMTNHHCAREYVAQVSRPGEDLLDNGFYASSLDAERPVEGLYVDHLIEIADVTEEVDAALAGQETDAERAQARQDVIRRIQDRLTEQSGGEESGIVVQVVSLYHGGRYSAYIFRRFGDVRLVMAPELQLGYYGGDWDNFTYPRYALDMAYLRVYQNGRPLQTANYFPWSTEGAEEGDLVFVVGNPGSTSRLETVAQLEFRRDVQERYLKRLIDTRLAAMEAYYAESPSDDLLNQIFSLRNVQKLYGGRLEGLSDPVLLARRRDSERQFREAIERDPALRAEYGTLLDRLADVQRQKAELAREYGTFLALQPTSPYASATLRRALLLHPYLTGRRSGAATDQLADLREQILVIEDQPRGLEERLLTARLRDIVEYWGADSPVVQEVLMGRTPEAQAAYLLDNSAVVDSARLAAALEGDRLNPDTDPALRLAGLLYPHYTRFQREFGALSAQQTELASRLGRARFDLFGTEVPPDATFSLRLADGVVQGYPYNGTIAPHQTTFYGLYDHYYSFMSEHEEWALPERWLAPPETFDLSTPMNLVSTNDIIGGNSGSPLLNRDLEVVGLVFDGNIESLPSAFIYRTESARTVSVDVRGMLEALDDVYDADRMVLELTTGRLVPTEEEADAVLSSRR